MTPKPAILIVDDEERNIRLLRAMLMPKNFELREATRGEEALRIAADTLPDMVLLDVMMPGLDGFEVCRRLKANEKTKIIPVIMVTALSEKEHRLKAMESGADDFLSKPVDHTELHIRVRSLLRIKAYEDELLRSYQEIAAKNLKLEELERIKDGLAHMIVHDLRNPLTAISTYLQLALMEKEALTEPHQEKLQRSIFFCDELNRLIQNLLDINKMEDGKMELNREVTNLTELIEEARKRFTPTLEEREITLSFMTAQNVPSVSIDPQILKRVFANIMDNAIRYTPRRGKIEVILDYAPETGNLCLSVKDNGRGLPAEYHQKIFDKFEQVKLKKGGKRAGSSGLGLTFCKMAVEAHGGKIWVESEGLGKGCTFHTQLPVSS